MVLSSDTETISDLRDRQIASALSVCVTKPRVPDVYLYQPVVARAINRAGRLLKLPALSVVEPVETTDPIGSAGLLNPERT